ncbi:hypothetical protein CBS101457_000468 [Exobasidium rhododendri]|nr:hypothetical protein CBS101457_000468 [Exobasidium rhododendri]
MQYPGKTITERYPSRMLCGKRYDNAMPFASSSGGSLHTCFEDTVLVPLASWLFLLAFLGYIAYAISMRKRSSGNNYKQAWHKLIYRKGHASNAALLQSTDKEVEESSTQRSTTLPSQTRWPKTSTSFSILYSLLVLAALLMNILEIVRLYLADRGAGLLPFSLASLVIILILMHVPLPTQLRPATGSVILVFWFFSVIFTAVQLSTLSSLMDVEPRFGTEYLNSDQIVDVSVFEALVSVSLKLLAKAIITNTTSLPQYAVALIVESVRVFRAFRARR